MKIENSKPGLFFFSYQTTVRGWLNEQYGMENSYFFDIGGTKLRDRALSKKKGKAKLW